ncbi:MAG: twin-arginine translocation pathway signal protein, partial [Pseudomonadota bacterium]
MSISRRKTLALLGGGFVVAAGGAGAGFLSTRTPTSALEAWSAAGRYDDPRMNALSYAILAPNPHNRQPWIADLSRPDTVTLYVDTNRLLPHTDPFSRQIVIGLGCFLEVLSLAAGQQGFRVDIDLFPDGSDDSALDDKPVAVIGFEPSEQAAEPKLFAQIPDRRSLKEPFDTSRQVSQSAIDALLATVTRGSHAATTNEADSVAKLRDLTAKALEIEFETPRTYKESVDLFRIGKSEVEANPDGIDFSGPMWEALHLTGLFSRKAAMDRDGFTYRSGLDMVRDTARTGMAYVWLISDTNSRYDQIVAGRDWVRVNLVATELGLGVQPMSQALQEYPEMSDLYADVHQMLASQGQTV